MSANATTEAAERGFHIYRVVRHRGTSLPREGILRFINKQLAREGHDPERPLQLRSLSHYDDLLAYGFVIYMPVNQFDVRITRSRTNRRRVSA